MTNWQELENKYYMQVVKRLPVTLVRGKGARVWDDQGKEYLDFVAGWAVNCLGHCHPVQVKALREQGRTLVQVSNQFYSVPQVQLAELLVKNSGFDRVFFANSGAEANEGAIKLARKYGKLRHNGAYEVITTFNSFHGRTLAMVAATGQPKYQEPYRPLPDGFVNVEFNNVEAIMAATGPNTCAVMVEPVQGEGGVNLPSPDYLKQVRAWCDEKGLLLIFDEVQTGIGRLGTLFGYQAFGIEPDVMTLAKGLGGGFPIGAFLAKEKAAVFEAGDHGSTFGGNPLACSVAHATLKYVLEKDIPGHAQEVGQYLLAKLQALKEKYPVIKEARGMGLLAALEFNADLADQIVKACLEKGLLVNRVKPNALRFMPPLILTRKEVDEGLNILEQALLDISQ